MSDPVGRMLGQYQIVREIGHGGMANVYLARQESMDREVAIKVLPTHFMQDRTFLDRFNREVRIISRLEHPRILPVYDFGEQDGMPFIVMRAMSGGSLADHINRSPGGLPLDETARLVEQIADGLDFAHEKGIIHRDFKPSNVLLDERGNVYLADFGIAKVSEATAQLTGSGVVGTPAYMAPEMASAGGVTSLVDVYALGVTLFQMLTGRLPYEADTPMGVLMAHVSKPAPDAREYRSDLPEGVQAVIAGAMAKNPAERYRSAGALATDLSAVVIAASQSMPPAPPEPASALEETAPPEIPDLYTLKVETPIPTPRRADRTREASQPHPVRRGRLPGWVWAVSGVGAIAVIAGVASLVSREASAGGAAQSAGGTATATSQPAETSSLIAALTDTPASTATLTITPSPTALGGGSGRILFSAWSWITPSNGRSDFYLVNADGSNLTQLPNPNGNFQSSPVWSPDGTQIAYSSNQHGVSVNSDVWIMNSDGANVRQLTDSLYDDDNPIWSPDGNRIAFYTRRYRHGDATDLAVLDVSTGEVTQVTSSGAVGWDAWSPDGARIIYSLQPTFEGQPAGSADLWIVNADGTDPQPLVTGDSNDCCATWSPDGTQIVFQSNRDGRSEIYVMNADGSDQTRLTMDGAAGPIWSPDGTHIAFVSERDGNWEIYIMNADGSNVIRLTNNAVNDISPCWSPDGQQLVFRSQYTQTQGGGPRYVLYIVNIDGSNLRELVDIPDADGIGYPSWQPATP